MQQAEVVRWEIEENKSGTGIFITVCSDVLESLELALNPMIQLWAELHAGKKKKRPRELYICDSSLLWLISSAIS